MDALLIAVAFVFGLIAQQLKLPPLVGFLVSGFVLQAMGKEGGPALQTMADLGVTLLLFCIGVKLKLRSLARPEIWAGTTMHTGGVMLACIPVLLIIAVGVLGIEWFDIKVAALIAFGLSFSSTVFAVKSLSENGDMASIHGRTAIGVLIMQDILAVLFLTFSTGKIPDLWAIPLLIALLGGRSLLQLLIGRSGHGEMIALCGLFLALVVGASGFDSVGLKGDLGALFVGILVGAHPKAAELNKSLLSITDLLLVAFFLQIGLQGSLSLQAVLWALLFMLLLPLKSIGFFLIFTRFHLRARTGWLSALSLSTYSEFGLIVLSLAVAKGWLGSEWLVSMALALSLSILSAAPLTRKADALYERIAGRLKRFETSKDHPDDLPIEIGDRRIAIFGMGRVGVAAYTYLDERFPGKIVGFDMDDYTVEQHQKEGRAVLLADATDTDFWAKVSFRERLDLAILALPNHSANVVAAETLKRNAFPGVVTAIGKFDDEVEELSALGTATAFNLYTEAGNGFAGHVYDVFAKERPELVEKWADTNRKA
ncbi:MAG: cation:proton antiporter [Opitutales bacterium]|nr:cation:proton antiporter [Opitutales bacterium]